MTLWEIGEVLPTFRFFGQDVYDWKVLASCRDTTSHVAEEKREDLFALATRILHDDRLHKLVKNGLCLSD